MYPVDLRRLDIRQHASACFGGWKHPEAFCFTLAMKMSSSARLSANGRLGSSENSSISALWRLKSSYRFSASVFATLPPPPASRAGISAVPPFPWPGRFDAVCARPGILLRPFCRPRFRASACRLASAAPSCSGPGTRTTGSPPIGREPGRQGGATWFRCRPWLRGRTSDAGRPRSGHPSHSRSAAVPSADANGVSSTCRASKASSRRVDRPSQSAIASCSRLVQARSVTSEMAGPARASMAYAMRPSGTVRADEGCVERAVTPCPCYRGLGMSSGKTSGIGPAARARLDLRVDKLGTDRKGRSEQRGFGEQAATAFPKSVPRFLRPSRSPVMDWHVEPGFQRPDMLTPRNQGLIPIRTRGTAGTARPCRMTLSKSRS